MILISRGLFAAAAAMLFVALPAYTQESSIYTQCPTETTLHPSGDGIKCKHLSGGDGMVTMADGKELYIFSFSDIPLPADSGVTLTEYPGYVMETGMLAANAPAPTIVVDEDDELFLSLTNVGMAMRPDLFDPHTVHWHGFPQAAAIFDGVPDASISINMGATLTYYYNAKDAGTYMYHCHVEATEHMQMGMLGNLYVRPRQNRCSSDPSIPCPPGHADGDTYAYNDGDGSTQYDVEYPIQIGSFDSEFHDASFGVQPLPFASMRDNYFLLNGRGYPDTTETAVISTPDPLGGIPKPSQPVSSLITATAGDRILLRISNLNVTQFNTLGTNGPAMEVIALDARLLRDDDGNPMYYKTNSVTLGGGQSADVIIETAGLGGKTFFLYSTNLDMLSNNTENFGGMMTEIRIN
ncbi:MAG: multicopper oxidase domain-containing protein [Gammaproteobacteria bacterium]|nr:multicopper oxidase domain-containing protein [Gammaproteobacteria bacterium]MDH5303788.1 multicopper oxidase domain-containing protein [Gammaproteobacteria bacterium]MDH5322196.1 multicopper oxidase domain-containing protein [Gammaproteobacteria bacterium]